MICLQFGDGKSVRGLRWIEIVRYFAERGVKIHVVTWQMTAIMDSLNLPNNVHVHCLNRQIGTPYRKGKSRSVFRFRVLKAVLRNFLWPDPNIFRAVRLFFLANSVLSDVLQDQKSCNFYSVGPPFSIHLAALILAKRFSVVRWMADVGDPLSGIRDLGTNNNLIFRQLNVALERSIHDLCDRLTVTTDELRQYYGRIFSTPNKVVVIPPMLRIYPLDVVRHDLKFDTEKRRFVFGYVGSWYEGIRSQEKFLSSFKQSVGNKLFGRIVFSCFLWRVSAWCRYGRPARRWLDDSRVSRHRTALCRS